MGKRKAEESPAVVVSVEGTCIACGTTGSLTTTPGSSGMDVLVCVSDICPQPDAVQRLIYEDVEVGHRVTFYENSFTVRHPLIERLDGGLESCGFMDAVAARSGPPARPGTYRVIEEAPGDFISGNPVTWEEIL